MIAKAKGTKAEFLQLVKELSKHWDCFRPGGSYSQGTGCAAMDALEAWKP